MSSWRRLGSKCITDELLAISGTIQVMTDIRHYILDGTPPDVIARYEQLPELASQSDFGALDSNVVVVDTETTGFSFTHDELIQIAAARLEQGRVVDWYVTFVNPGKEIPEDIVHLTGITDELVAEAPSPEDALAGLVEFAGDAIMVAHNVGFDKTFTTNHPSGYPLLENLWIDSLDLSRIALPRLKSHRLIDLVKTFGAPTSTHRADDDVAATCVVYRILLAAVASMPKDLVDEIAHMDTQGAWSTQAVFSFFSTGSLEVPETNESNLFSVSTMRKRRIDALPPRLSRKDADDLVGVLQFPSQEEIDDCFSKDGMLGVIYEDYEAREEQRSMAQAILKAFETSENLVVEAGTGVGKSMAYLVPSILMAKANGIAIGVSTKTNSLLDQLVYSELPSLAEAYSQLYPEADPITWAPLKGMSHYLCLRKVSRMVEHGPTQKEVNGQILNQAPALAALLSYIEQTEFDDMDSLKIDYRALPRYMMTTTSNECLRRKCPFFGRSCFVHGARRRAESADVIVTNHTLLFCDLAADGGLLPTVRHWIVDEAHATEAEARTAFAESLDSEIVEKIVTRVTESSASRNVFERATRGIEKADGEQLTLFFGLIEKGRAAGEGFAQAAREYVLHVKDLLYFDPSKKASNYEHADIWLNDEVRNSTVFQDLRIIVHELVEKSDVLIKACQDLVAYLEGIDEAAVAQREIAALAMDVRAQRNAAELIFDVAPESYVYQASLVKKKDRHVDKVEALLLDVGDKLNETLYASSHSVVFASATLTVGGRFDSFKDAVGLGRTEFSQFKELALDSHFDFDNNMIIYVVKDMPEPNERSYSDKLAKMLIETHRAQQGSMLTLFTNRREMEKCFDVVNPALQSDGLRLVCQKWGVSVKGLRDDFVADQHLSLFALKSFWEGFDAPGATLRGVVITKLPFGRPTDPLYCERAARDDRAWWKYVLPQAVIETKQAAGRLIRKADDRGVLILADKRLITKKYGQTFLKSLQSKTVRVCTMEEIAASLHLMSGSF